MKPAPARPLFAAAAAAALLALLAGPAGAQADRYELGRRLRALEQAWAATPSPAARQEALPHAERAVRSFFTFRLTAAARALDEARLALEGEAGPARRAGLAVRAVAEAPCVGRGTSLAVDVAPLYEVERPEGRWALRLELRGDGDAVFADARRELDGGPLRLELATADAPEGDHVLRATVLHDGRPVATSEQLVSVVADLAARLEALEGAGGEDTEGASLAGLVDLVAGLRRGRRETDLPAARLLADAEAARAASGPFFAGRPGPQWLRLVAPGETRAVPARVEVGPEALATGEPLPVVVALHGAGGTENMWSDAYGAGLAARLCAERGWLLVAPRVGMFGGAPVADVVDALAGLYPIDRERVFVLGHSAGAAAGAAAVAAAPDRYAALALLGGGGRIGDARLDALPVYVGAGTRDFGRGGAERAAAAFEAAGADVRYVEHTAEHLLVVAEALPDAFALFDRVAGAAAPAPAPAPAPPGRRYY